MFFLVDVHQQAISSILVLFCGGGGGCFGSTPGDQGQFWTWTKITVERELLTGFCGSIGD